MIALKNIAKYSIGMWAGGLFLVNSSWAGIPIEHWVQPSGAKVYLVQSPAIPMVDVQIDFDAGSRRDPVVLAGLAPVTAMFASKGIQAGPTPLQPAMDENALGEAWADLGASFAAHADADRMGFSLRSLTYPDLLTKAAQLAARQLAAPSFPPDVWARERDSLQASWREANTRPATVSGRAFTQAVYGNHPYGFEMTSTTLAQITTTDMQRLHDDLIQPCHAKVTVVGALTQPQTDALVLQLLAPLVAKSGPRCTALPLVNEVWPLREPKEVRVPFDSAQAHVLIGQPGIKRSDPDFLTLLVGNHILGGGGFVSRLTQEVREKRGLSYSVFSEFAPGMHTGAFTVSLQTRPDQAELALGVAREVLAKFVAEGPTPAELAAAKSNLIGGFALRIDSNRKLLGNVANIAWNDLPLDYLDTWAQRVAQITAADIQAAFARHLDPHRMVTVVLGGQP